MKFSQRIGVTPIDTKLQTQGMNDNLRNSIWNVLHKQVFSTHDFLYGTRTWSAAIESFSDHLWMDFFKKPLDTRPENPNQIMELVRQYYFKAPWHEVYDFLEFVLGYLKDNSLTTSLNEMLDRELAGYRYISGAIVSVTDAVEVEAIGRALADSPYSGVRTHLKQALHLMSRRDKPDYRNSIKESISAVESLARELTKNPKASLGDALALLEKKHALHGSLKRGFSALYGYTSDENGIRHAMQEEPIIGVAEAKYFLVACSCFINYLVSRASEIT